MSTTVEPQNDDDEIQSIRDAVRALCMDYPGEYWREKDRERAYPTEFVQTLTEKGFLAVLIPEEYGGSGLGIKAAAAILEEIQRSGANGGGCHAQMYTMGTLLRHGSQAQKEKWLPQIASGALRLQAFGVTEPTSGTDTLSLRTTATRQGDKFIVNGQNGAHQLIGVVLCANAQREEQRAGGERLSVFAQVLFVEIEG